MGSVASLLKLICVASVLIMDISRASAAVLQWRCMMSAVMAIKPGGMMSMPDRAMPLCAPLPIRESVLGQDAMGDVAGEAAPILLVPAIKWTATVVGGWLIGNLAWDYAGPHIKGAVETAYYYDGSGGAGHYGQEALMAEVYDHISDYDDWMR